MKFFYLIFFLKIFKILIFKIFAWNFQTNGLYMICLDVSALPISHEKYSYTKLHLKYVRILKFEEWISNSENKLNFIRVLI